MTGLFITTIILLIACLIVGCIIAVQVRIISKLETYDLPRCTNCRYKDYFVKKIYENIVRNDTNNRR